MIALLALSLAHGHGGEDHGAPAPPVASASDATSVATWSTEFEAVARFPYAPPGEEVHGTLLIADFRTSAPVDSGEITLTLDGPGHLEITPTPTSSPGIWEFTTTFPAEGAWHGGLQVITADRADILGVPEFEFAAPAHAHDDGGWGWPWIAGALGIGLGGGLLIGLGSGFGLGRWRRAAAAAPLAGLLVAARGMAHGGEDHGPPPPPQASTGDGALHMALESQFLLEVRTAKATRGPFEEHVRALGTAVARPGGSAEIHAPVTGVLAFPEGADLAPGKAVKVDQPLATIAETLGGADRSGVVSGRTEAQIRLAEAKKKVTLAERDVDRAQSLGGVLSERERLEREQALKLAREEVRQAQSAVSALAGDRPTTTLRAPIAGRISALLARPGDVVSPGEVLMRILQEGGVWIDARVPETLAGHLLVGATATIHADARPDVALGAHVLDPGLEADPKTGTLRVTLSVDEVAAWLVPGMTVNASIVHGEAREALSVPDAAVVDSGGESLVFVKTAPESFEARRVRVGALSGDRREILLGLEPGERVVVQGTYALRSLAGR